VGAPGAGEALGGDHRRATPVAVERELAKLGAKLARLPHGHRREFRNGGWPGALDDRALGPEEAKARHLLELDELVRHGELRLVRLAGGDHQKIGGHRIGQFLVLGVVRHEPSVIRLGVGDQEGLPLPAGQRGEA
jgi:hypothetical protein